MSNQKSRRPRSSPSLNLSSSDFYLLIYLFSTVASGTRFISFLLFGWRDVFICLLIPLSFNNLPVSFQKQITELRAQMDGMINDLWVQSSQRKTLVWMPETSFLGCWLIMSDSTHSYAYLIKERLCLVCLVIFFFHWLRCLRLYKPFFFLSFKTNPFTLCDNTEWQKRDEPPPPPSHLSEVNVAN